MKFNQRVRWSVVYCVTIIDKKSGPGLLSRYSDTLRAGGSGDRIPVEVRLTAPVQAGPWTHPALYTMGTGSFPGVKRPVRGVDHPAPSSAEAKERIELYINSPLGPSWPVREWNLTLMNKKVRRMNWSWSFQAQCYFPKHVIWSAVYFELKPKIEIYHRINCDYVEVQLQVFFKCRHSLSVTGQLPNWTRFAQDKRYQYPWGRYSAVICELLRRTFGSNVRDRTTPEVGGCAGLRPQRQEKCLSLCEE